ncbi:hypothetical protein KC19_VG116300 [Ceratodon purpureus]|uniref:Secreted protein n=1 Tax=Ceratodon purpureus TaxID=3225 RepID=A0A8T0HPF3_CERPU|nr:hypothetical protein KC19_VG116300 [Ceratodon purpureus]
MIVACFSCRLDMGLGFCVWLSFGTSLSSVRGCEVGAARGCVHATAFRSLGHRIDARFAAWHGHQFL